MSIGWACLSANMLGEGPATSQESPCPNAYSALIARWKKRTCKCYRFRKSKPHSKQRSDSRTEARAPSGTPWSFRWRGVSMAWILLIFAGLLEVLWAFTMKQSNGFTRLGASIVTVVAMIASFGLLSVSMKTLPLGTAYTIWTGIGALGAFLVGIVVLSEPMNLLRVVAAVLIVSGLILMKVAAG